MKIGRKWQTALAVALLVLCGVLLVAARQRGESPAPATSRDLSNSAALAKEQPSRPNGNARSDRADASPPASVPQSIAGAGAPTAECLAARAAEATDKAELEAMSPTQLDAAIDAAAHASVAEADAWKRAHEACLELPGRKREDCDELPGFPVAAQTAEERVDNALMVAAMREEAFRIAGHGDARSLVAAAQLLPLNYPADPSNPAAEELANRHPLEAIGWLVRAQPLGRDDALVQWAVATLVPFDPKSSPSALGAAQAAARQRLRALEPDNAAAYLLSLPERPERARPYSREEIARASALPRYRTRSPDLVRNAVHKSLDNSKAGPTPQLRAALRRQIQGSDPRHAAAVACSSDEDLIINMRLLMAVTPLFASGAPVAPWSSCTPKDPGDTETDRESCLRLAELVYAGGVSVEKIPAVARARHLATAGPARDLWDQRIRLLRWRNSHVERMYREIDPIQVSRIAWDAWTRGDEDLAIDEMLRRIGVAPEPPPDWKMPDYP